MSDLISRQVLLLRLADWQLQESPNWGASGMGDAKVYETLKGVEEMIQELPTIEPGRDIKHAESISLISAEPKRGKWITKKDACGIGYQICSNCETEIQWRDRHGVVLRVDMQNAPYCPNCGAKMNG